jgi:hypothetical protein
VNGDVNNLAHRVRNQAQVSVRSSCFVLCELSSRNPFSLVGRLCATRQAQHRARNNPHSMQQWEYYRLDLAAHSNAEGCHCGHSVRSSE